MGYFFEKLGIYGLEQEKEDAILATLLTGDPMLLIGKQGTAKTAIAETIGSCFRELSKMRIAKGEKDVKLFEYRIYDSSKINFEDLIGFPNPAKMQQGTMDFIQSPMTVWGAELVVLDEFNRQEPARQNNIFELTRSRRIMGRPTGTKWFYNCMNPFGMAGTEELDAALVDRHQFFIHVTPFTNLSGDAQFKIVTHVGNSDGIAMKYWSGTKGEFDVDDSSYNEIYAKGGEELERIMRLAAKHYAEVMKESGKAYAKFVARFWNTLTSEMHGKDWAVELSGRRAGMVHRALVAFRAIDLAMCDINPTRTLYSLKAMFKMVLPMTIPIGITTAGSSGASGAPMISIQTNVDMFNQFFNEKDPERAISAIDIIYELVTTKNIRRKIELVVDHVTDDIAKNQVWSEMIQTKPNQHKFETMRNKITIGVVAHLMTVNPDIVPANMQAQIAKLASSCGTINGQFEVRGQLAYYATEVKDYMSGLTNPFSLMQAQLMLEEFSENNLNVLPRSTFNSLMQNIANECKLLERMLKERKINDQQSVATSLPTP